MTKQNQRDEIIKETLMREGFKDLHGVRYNASVSILHLIFHQSMQAYASQETAHFAQNLENANSRILGLEAALRRIVKLDWKAEIIEAKSIASKVLNNGN